MGNELEKFMAQLYINGNTTVSSVGIVFESNCRTHVSFPMSLNLQYMHQKILRRIRATSDSRVTSLRYRWCNPGYGELFSDFPLNDDEDVEEMVTAIKLSGKYAIDILAMVDDGQPRLSSEHIVPSQTIDACYSVNQQSAGPSEPYYSGFPSYTDYSQVQGMEEILEMMIRPTTM